MDDITPDETAYPVNTLLITPELDSVAEEAPGPDAVTSPVNDVM